MGLNFRTAWASLTIGMALLTLLGCGSSGSGLSGKTPDARALSAADKGVRGADEGIPILLKAIEMEPEIVQLEAITALGRIGTPAATKALCSLATNPSRGVRSAVIQALSDIDPTAYPFAVATLVEMGKKVIPKTAGSDPDRDMRRAITTSLSVMKQKESIPFLLDRLLNDPDEQIRNAAVMTLGRIKDNRPVEGLIEICQNDTERNRAWAIEALGKIGDPRGIPSVEKGLSDFDAVTRGKAATALATLKGKEAVPMIKAALTNEQNDLTGVVMAYTMVKLGEKSYLEALHHYIQFSPVLLARAEAGRVLAEVGTCEETLPIVDRVFDTDREGMVKREAGNAARALISRCPEDQVNKMLKSKAKKAK